jgi:hypothetical protein
MQAVHGHGWTWHSKLCLRFEKVGSLECLNDEQEASLTIHNNGCATREKKAKKEK